MILRIAILLLAFAASAAAQAATQSKPLWSDEFDAPAKTLPDPGKWTYDLGGNGWGNHELEVYTNTRDNVFHDGQGHLVIRAVKTASGGYTSARIKTQGKFEIRYGRIEARMKIPYGLGIWPAFWMLGTDISTAGWPTSGEIDIMENIGKEPFTIHGTVHGPGYSGGNAIGKGIDLPSGERFSADFHVYAVEWSPDRIEFSLDGRPYFNITPASLPAGSRWVFDHPFFVILNLAVGGSWPGNPDATSTFPQDFTIDWVRVWEQTAPTR